MSDPDTSMRHSPLDAEHRALDARMVPFGGWEMPIQYSGVLEEHRACREDAVVFDVSHLGSVRVSGPGARSVLQWALTNDLGRIEPGKAQYTHLLDPDDAHVVDDIIVWWVGEQELLVMPNASNTAPLVAALEDASRDHADDACTGYTGEDGVELHVPATVAPACWRRLVAAGIQPAGLGARDTLRLEAGLPLHGHELGPGITPLQAGLAWGVRFDKGDFRGRDALLAERERGVTRRLRGLEVDGRQVPRAECVVSIAGARVGEVTSGNFSPMLGRGIALAFLPPDVADGTEVTIDVRGRSVPAHVVKTPFVHRDS